MLFKKTKKTAQHNFNKLSCRLTFRNTINCSGRRQNIRQENWGARANFVQIYRDFIQIEIYRTLQKNNAELTKKRVPILSKKEHMLFIKFPLKTWNLLLKVV